MDSNDLPAALRDLIERVVRATWLWPSEKRDVRAELESHFQEGLAELTEGGTPPEQAATRLRERFGDPKLAARLIRRGKRRSRSMIWKLFARTTCAFAIVVVATGTYAGWLIMGKPSPSVDYVAKLNEATDAVPAEDRAWPLWERILVDFKPMPEALRTPWREQSLVPGCDDWPQVLAWIEANRRLMPAIREAAAKPSLGFRYHAPQGGDSMVGRDDPDKQSDPAAPGDNAIFVSPMLSVELPDLGPARREVARFLLLDARARAADGDFAAAWQSAETAHRMGLQLFGPRMLIEQMVGAAIIHSVTDVMRRLLYDGRSDLTPPHLQRLGKSYLMTIRPEQIRPDYTFERYSFEDLVQHLFTDDGNGDGRLIPVQLRRLLDFYDFAQANADRRSRKPDSKNDHRTRQADRVVLTTIVTAVHAGRKETMAKFEELWGAISHGLDVPLGDPSRVRADELKPADDLEGWRHCVLRFFPPVRHTDVTIRERVMGHQATQAIVALLRYKADNKRFPATLDAIVPDYMNEVPIDVYTGDRLRYSVNEAGEMLLYSVSRNLEDDGGSTEDVQNADVFFEGKYSADIVYWPPPAKD